MMILLVINLVLTVVNVLSTPEIEISVGKRLYNDYQVLRAYPVDDSQRSVLLLLEDDVDMWTDLTPNSTSVDLMVGPSHVTRVKEMLAFNLVNFQVMIADLQTNINLENVDALDYEGLDKKRDKRQNGPLDFLLERTRQILNPVVRRPRHQSGTVRNQSQSSANYPQPSNSYPTPVSPCAKSGMNWNQYQSHKTMTSWMKCLATNFSHRMSLINIGKSSEGRPLIVARVGTGQNEKPAVFIDGGIHAREWASPAAVTFLLHKMVENQGDYDNILNRFTVYILPMANPDGYEYSRNHDRMWRKTRSKSGVKNLFGQECHGVDPNRNFGYFWGGYGASDNPCKETFRGKSAFSIPETRAIRDFLLQTKADFKLYLTFHTYGQYILYPWGYDALDTRDVRDLKRVGEATGNALRRQNGVKYEVGSAAKMLYPASGGSDDWAKGGAGIKYSYTVELPDTGDYGFLLPARFIKNVGVQTETVLKTMVTEIMKTLPES